MAVGINTASLLHRASRGIRRARIQAGLRAASGQAVVILFIALLASSVVVVISRWRGTSQQLAVWVGVSGLFVAVSRVMARVGPILLRSYRTRELAERLDLAVSDQNAVATAIDLASKATPSAFEFIAIKNGLDALCRYAENPPSVDVVTIRYRRNAVLLGVGLLMLAGALEMPEALVQSSRTAGLEVVSALPAFAAESVRDRPTLPATSRREASKSSSFPDGGSAVNPSLPTHSLTASNSSPSGASSQNAGLTSGSSASPKAAQAPVTNPALSAASSFEPGTPAPQQSAQQLASMATGGSAASAYAASAGSSDDGAGEDSGSASASSVKDGVAHNGNSNQASDPSASEAGQKGGGGYSNAEAKMKSGLGGRSADSSQGSGGTGQSGGQNPPKKSRGVAPALLGVRVPDLLKGRQLPGPLERSTLQIPSQPAAGNPTTDAEALPRNQGESAVEVFQVPAGVQTAVARYFEKYHQDHPFSSNITR
jgi:hypothetical protein